DGSGKTITEVVNAVETGDIRMLYIMGENPMISDANLDHVEHALKNCELLIVQDIFLTETAELADVVLPAACYAEKEGTFTNTERRVQRIRRAVSAPGESREDWVILSDLMGLLGYENKFTSSKEILEEIAQVTPSYGGFSYDRLDKEQPQWPCPSQDHPGTPILHTAKFSRGERAIFKPSPYIPAVEQPDSEYPLILTTGRILYQYHTRTMTGKSDDINRVAGSSFVEIHPTDAAKQGIAQGDEVRVASRRGEVVVEARVTERVSEGVIFMPFHFADAPANRLTNNVVDPISKIPEYKVCSARIQRL
ncbi:MAG TPA: formate dehydrogenase subunit alpha, partial [Firmicutes bacterium]|nr:formate dehydrogenase subunit alpha [Bacillota bacterium]